MKIVLLAFLALVFAVDIESEFAQWTAANEKMYTAEEYQHRLAIFTANLDLIQQLNENSNGAVYALNKFADLAPEEFKAIYLGYVPGDKEVDELDLSGVDVAAVPDTFDWVSKGKTTPVKNQEQCGSCWAFSATENIESVWMIAKDLTPSNFKPLAPQQIVDCDKQDGGCNGGNPPTAYDYIIKAGGQDTEASYPYHAVNQACQFKPADVEVKIASYKTISNENDMKTATATVAPLSICVDAAQWQFYSSGVMTPSQCGTSLDHCVQAVGYDTSANPPYWNVRNSWGTDWGMQGFIRLEYGHNTCGLTEETTTAVV
jgi:C1A family cysteine protease